MLANELSQTLNYTGLKGVNTVVIIGGKRLKSNSPASFIAAAAAAKKTDSVCIEWYPGESLRFKAAFPVEQLTINQQTETVTAVVRPSELAISDHGNAATVAGKWPVALDLSDPTVIPSEFRDVFAPVIVAS